MINDKNLYKQPKLYVISTILFFIIAAIFFCWQLWETLSTSRPIDHAIWGQFGDFVGGTLGVVFSMIGVIFVVFTFKSQQRTAYEQRFNDMFFETLRMYHEQEKELQFKYKENIEGTAYKGESNYKDFFDRVKKETVKKFHPQSSFSHNRKSAIQQYAEVCIPFGGKLSLCYKSIYRLLDMIDHSPISEDVRLEYAKLLRSQFTENELLCLRYHIKFGDYRKFAYLANKFNIMKHLPIFDLLEFNYWSGNEKLSDIERREIGNLFIIVAKQIRQRENCQIVRCNGQLIIDIQIKDSCLKLSFSKYPLQKASQDYVAGLYKFEDESIENLLECILKEIVVFSNFSCYNNYSELSFNSKIREYGAYKQIEATVTNRKKKLLALSFAESNLSASNMPLLH